jgi:hypothetical protein
MRVSQKGILVCFYQGVGNLECRPYFQVQHFAYSADFNIGIENQEQWQENNLLLNLIR